MSFSAVMASFQSHNDSLMSLQILFHFRLPVVPINTAGADQHLVICSCLGGRCCADNILSTHVGVDLMACPTHGARESQMQNTSLISVKMDDQGATRGKVTHKRRLKKKRCYVCVSPEEMLEKGWHTCGYRRARWSTLV